MLTMKTAAVSVPCSEDTATTQLPFINRMRAACLELAALQACHRLQDRLDGVPLDALEEIAPAPIQGAVNPVVQHHFEVGEADGVALPRQFSVKASTSHGECSSRVCWGEQYKV